MNTAFITDPHGQSKKIDSVLASVPANTFFVFIGDLIDNSLKAAIDHKQAINTVRDIVLTRRGLCTMGNHELNAIGWSLKKEDGTYCRSHTKEGNVKQHAAFLRDYPFGSDEYNDVISWFKTLPIYVETPEYRAIHALWDDNAIAKIQPYLNEDKSIKEQHWYDAFDEQHELYHLTETLLKGAEFALPDGISYKDKTGIERTNARLAWWKFPTTEGMSLEDICLSVPPAEMKKLAGIPIPESLKGESWTGTDRPTFIGHYTLPTTRSPEPLAENIVCCDFNGARDENPLWAYLLTESDLKTGYFIEGATEC